MPIPADAPREIPPLKTAPLKTVLLKTAPLRIPPLTMAVAVPLGENGKPHACDVE